MILSANWYYRDVSIRSSNYRKVENYTIMLLATCNIPYHKKFITQNLEKQMKITIKET